MAFKLAKAYVELHQRGLDKVTNLVGGLKRRLLALVNPIGLVSGALAAIGVTGGVSSMLKLSANAESLAVSFEVLLGSAEKAKEMMEDINRFAAKTPFEQQELAGVTKQLLGYGVAQEDIIPTLKQLGDMAALSGSRLDELARAFGKAKGKGKVQGEVFEMFTDRGIGIMKELAKVIGVAETEVADLGSKGKVSFGHLQEAMRNMTSEGGLYYQGMEKLSGTKGGLWSTLTGNVKVAMGQVGTMIYEAFNLGDVLKDAGSFAENFKANFGEQIKTALQTVAQWAAYTWESIKALAGWIRNLWEAHGPLILKLAKFAAILGGVVVAVSAVSAVISALGAGIAFLVSPIGLVVVAMAALAVFFEDAFKGIVSDLMYLIQNWDMMWRLAWENTKLAVSNTWERVKTFFVNIGELLVWFAGNWQDVFLSAAKLVASVFSNVWHNLREGWNELWSWISGRDYEADFKPLLDGFKSTIKELPELTKAAVRKSTPEIDRIYQELAKREEAKQRKAAKQQAKAQQTQAEKAAGQTVPAGAAPPAGQPERAAAAGPPIGTFGYSALASKMQDAALKEMEKKDVAAEKTARATEQLNQAAQGEGLKVRPAVGGGGGNLLPTPLPAWG